MLFPKDWRPLYASGQKPKGAPSPTWGRSCWKPHSVSFLPCSGARLGWTGRVETPAPGRLRCQQEAFTASVPMGDTPTHFAGLDVNRSQSGSCVRPRRVWAQLDDRLFARVAAGSAPRRVWAQQGERLPRTGMGATAASTAPCCATSPWLAAGRSRQSLGAPAPAAAYVQGRALGTSSRTRPWQQRKWRLLCC